MAGPAEPGGILLERGGELERIERCLTRAREGQGNALVAEGAAGIGKTASWQPPEILLSAKASGCCGRAAPSSSVNSPSAWCGSWSNRRCKLDVKARTELSAALAAPTPAVSA